MISLVDVIELHHKIVEISGGGNGVRDEGSLMAALARPYATFDQIDLYPTPIEKASAIFESIVINHLFIDGNKRTAYVLMRLTLREGGFDLKVSEAERYEMVIAASQGEIRFDEIKAWLEKTPPNYDRRRSSSYCPKPCHWQKQSITLAPA